MSNLAALLGLDPLRPEPMLPAPFFEDRSQSDDVQEGLFPHHPSDRRAVVVVEVAVDGNPARLCKSDRLLDLSPLEIALAERLAHAPEVTAFDQGRSAERRKYCMAAARARVAGCSRCL